MSNSASAVPESTIDSGATTPQPPGGKTKIRPGKLQWSFLLMNFALYGVVGAVSGVFLPLQLQDAAPENYSTVLGIALSIGAISAMLTQPFIGWLSDRTHTRLGRRSPFILAGGFLVAGVLVGMAIGGNSAFFLGLGWCLVQVTINVLKSPLQAIVSDRVVKSTRGTTSTFIGVGTMIGGVGGATAGAKMTGVMTGAYMGLALFFLVCAIVFVLVNPDKSNLDEAIDRQAESAEPKVKAAFPLNFVKFPDFSWLFTARFLFVLGYMWYGSYKIYVMQDFIGLSKEAAIGLIPSLSIVSLLTILIATVLTGPISDKIGRRRIFLVIASVATALGVLLPFLAPSVPTLFLADAIIGIGFGVYSALSVAVMTDVLPNVEVAARDLGIMNMASTLAQTFSPLLAAAVIGGVAGRYGMMLAVGAAIVVSSVFAFMRIKAFR